MSDKAKISFIVAGTGPACVFCSSKRAWTQPCISGFSAMWLLSW